MTLTERLKELAWLLRRNIDEDDRRMAQENVNSLICLLETGDTAHDLPSARRLHAAVTEAQAYPRGDRGMRLVRAMGAGLRPAALDQQAGLVEEIERLKGALEPFARYADGVGKFTGPKGVFDLAYESSVIGKRDIVEGDFIRARQALSGDTP